MLSKLFLTYTCFTGCLVILCQYCNILRTFLVRNIIQTWSSSQQLWRYGYLKFSLTWKLLVGQFISLVSYWEKRVTGSSLINVLRGCHQLGIRPWSIDIKSLDALNTNKIWNTSLVCWILLYILFWSVTRQYSERLFLHLVSSSSFWSLHWSFIHHVNFYAVGRVLTFLQNMSMSLYSEIEYGEGKVN